MLLRANNETGNLYPSTEPIFSVSDFINSPVKLAAARHFATHAIQNGNMALKKRIIQESLAIGLLSPNEVKFCKNFSVVLPGPRFVNHYAKIPGWHFARMDGITMLASEPPYGPIPVYILTGVFDCFTGGHHKFTQDAINLAHKNHGKVACLIESDYYSNAYKNKLPVFPHTTRASWFRDFVSQGLMIGTWPDYFILSLRSSHPDTALSWVEGFKLLRESLPARFRKNIHMVIPKSTMKMPEREIKLFHIKREQILDHGFSVDELPSWLGDISTTILRERFQLKPLDRDRVKLLA